MSAYHLKVLSSSSQLRAAAADWDALWQKSDCTAPAARANLVALWADHFFPNSPLAALAVEHEGRLVAALPMVVRPLRRMIHVAAMPTNCWSCCGDLLLDPDVDADAALDVLVKGIAELDASLLWLEHVALEAPAWQKLFAACRRAALGVSLREQYRIGVTEIGSDFEHYESTRKGDHRRSRRRYARLLDAAGGARLELVQPAAADVRDLMLRGFEVEDRSWKGAAGTSVLQTPGIFDYMVLEARQLAQWNQLEICFLEHDQKTIAFEYGWRAKGVHYMPKLGYDDDYSRFGPGQQLIMRLLERLHADPSCHRLDFWGPLMPWSESWSTSSYSVGRAVIATRQALGRGLFRAYDDWQPRLRGLSQKLRSWPAARKRTAATA